MTISNKIVDFLDNNQGESFSIDEIASHLGVHRETTRKYALQLNAQGRAIMKKGDKGKLYYESAYSNDGGPMSAPRPMEWRESAYISTSPTQSGSQSKSGSLELAEELVAVETEIERITKRRKEIIAELMDIK